MITSLGCIEVCAGSFCFVVVPRDGINFFDAEDIISEAYKKWEENAESFNKQEQDSLIKSIRDLLEKNEIEYDIYLGYKVKED